MSENNTATVAVNVALIQSRMADFDTKREAMRIAREAFEAAKAEYSASCEAMAEAIPGKVKSVNRTIDGVKRKLTFSKAGKGGGWSCRGLSDREEQELIDLDNV